MIFFQKKYNEYKKYSIAFRLVLNVMLLFLYLAQAANAQSVHQLQREGDAAYDKKEFQKAEEIYRKAEEKKPSQGKGSFNLGNTKFQQKQYDEAAKEYSQAAEKFWKKEDQATAFYNLGNTYLEKKEYNKSVDAYKNALRRNPEDLATKKNLMLALQKKKKEEDNKKQQQKQNKNQQKQQNQDKNQQNQQQQQNKNQEQNQEELQQQKIPQDKLAQQLLLKSLDESDKKTLRKVQQKDKTTTTKNAKDW